MDDRIFFPLIGVFALALIALATVWPQGLGARSPGPFGSTPYQQTAEAKAAITREEARKAIADVRAQAAALKADQQAAEARAAARSAEEPPR